MGTFERSNLRLTFPTVRVETTIPNLYPGATSMATGKLVGRGKQGGGTFASRSYVARSGLGGQRGSYASVG